MIESIKRPFLGALALLAVLSSSAKTVYTDCGGAVKAH